MNPDECQCSEPVPDYQDSDICIRCGKEIVTEYLKKLRSYGWRSGTNESWNSPKGGVKK